MKGIIKCGIHTTNHIIKGRCMCYRLYRFYFVVLLFLCLHTSIQAQISVEVTSGLALPGGDLESTYSSSLGYNVNLCNKVTGSSSEYLASYAFQTFSSTNSSENYKGCHKVLHKLYYHLNTNILCLKSNFPRFYY